MKGQRMQDVKRSKTSLEHSRFYLCVIIIKSHLDSEHEKNQEKKKREKK